MLKGKNAIITGANGGIGFATVEAFAKNGSNIWACIQEKDDLFASQVEQMAQKYGVTIHVEVVDLTDDGQIKQCVKNIFAETKQIDSLINLAGTVSNSSLFSMTSKEQMNHVFNVNYWGAVSLTQYVSRIMMKNNSGSIVFVSSVAALDGTPGQFEYASSKGALLGATKQLSKELGRFGVRVNCIAPGVISTKMSDKIDADLKNSVLSNVALGRVGNPSEVANVLVFLSSDLSSYIDGQIIRIDGGL